METSLIVKQLFVSIENQQYMGKEKSNTEYYCSRMMPCFYSMKFKKELLTDHTALYIFEELQLTQSIPQRSDDDDVQKQMKTTLLGTLVDHCLLCSFYFNLVVDVHVCLRSLFVSSQRSDFV